MGRARRDRGDHPEHGDDRRGLFPGARAEEARESFDLIVEAAESGSALTSQLLSFARRRVGARCHFDLEERVARTLPLIRRLVGRAIHISHQTSGRPCPVFLDPTHLDLAMLEAEREAVDLLFSDVAMPQMDGLELARRVRETHPDLPVLLTTGYMGETGLEDARRPYPVLPKPYRAHELLAAVERAVTGAPPALPPPVLPEPGT